MNVRFMLHWVQCVTDRIIRIGKIIFSNFGVSERILVEYNVSDEALSHIVLLAMYDGF
jgi:hypothetical protein